MNFGSKGCTKPRSRTGQALSAICSLGTGAIPAIEVTRVINQFVDTKEQAKNVLSELYKRGYLQRVIVVTDKAKQRVARDAQ